MSGIGSFILPLLHTFPVRSANGPRFAFPFLTRGGSVLDLAFLAFDPIRRSPGKRNPLPVWFPRWFVFLTPFLFSPAAFYHPSRELKIKSSQNPNRPSSYSPFRCQTQMVRSTSPLSQESPRETELSWYAQIVHNGKTHPCALLGLGGARKLSHHVIGQAEFKLGAQNLQASPLVIFGCLLCLLFFSFHLFHFSRHRVIGSSSSSTQENS